MSYYPMNILDLPPFLIVFAIDSWFASAIAITVIRRINDLNKSCRITELTQLIEIPVHWFTERWNQRTGRHITVGQAWIAVIVTMIVIRQALCLMLTYRGS